MTALGYLLALVTAFAIGGVWHRANPSCPICGSRLWNKAPSMHWRCRYCMAWYDPCTGRTL
jgi:tRNA(Ile2) C34 agmatinyltransferase TiaS